MPGEFTIHTGRGPAIQGYYMKLKSLLLASAAVLIAVAWLLMLADGMRVYRYAFLLLGIVIWAVSYWTHGRAARHPRIGV